MTSQTPVELLLGAPVTAKRIRRLLEQAYQEIETPLTVEQIDAFNVLMVDAAAGRAYLIRSKGQQIGFVFVSFRHSVHFGGRIAVLDELYLAPPWRDAGCAARVLRATMQDLEAFGVPILTATAGSKGVLAGAFSSEDFDATPCRSFVRKLWINKETSGSIFDCP